MLQSLQRHVIIKLIYGGVCMKRSVHILTTALICLVMFFPITVYGETYHLGGTDMSIQVDDSSWYVFTRDNIKNNSELDELEISYDSMYDILYNNEAYMDAILLYKDGQYVELFIRKRAIDSGMANLSNYDEKQVLELAEGLAKRQNAEKYSIYESQYKYAKLEYIDSNLGYYICEFYTVVNKDNYTFTFQSTTPFIDSEYDEMENIIDSIQFDVDTTLKEKKNTSFGNNVIEVTIGGAIIGGVVGLIINITNKKKTIKKNNESSDVDNIE